MENNTNNTDLLKSQGLTYTKKSKKLEDAKSSSWLFIVFGAVGLLLILAVWLNIIPLNMAFYMRILYTIVLGVLFLVFILIGIYYTRKIKVLETETTSEEQQSDAIIRWVTDNYSLESLDSSIEAEELSEEQLYFERYGQLSALIQEKYQIKDEAYLDYLIEKIYQTYFPES